MRNTKKPKGKSSDARNHSSNGKKNKKIKKKSGGLKKFFKITFITLFILFLVSGVAMAGVGLAMIKTAPPLNVDKILKLDEPAKFYDDEGNFIDEYITLFSRENVSINQVPINLQNAFIAIEDERFEDHHGIDWYRFAGAMKGNVKTVFNKLTGKPSGSIQGASTITQQLIKQRMFLKSSLENRLDVERKVQEMYLAWQLDNKLSKKKILEAYLNTLPLGSKAYGIKAAAKQYFSKELSELTLVECAFLASAAQNPGNSHLLASRSVENNNGVFPSQRTLAVLNKMLELGYISQQEFDEATKDKITDNKIAVAFDFTEASSDEMNYEYFSRIVIETVTEDLKKQGKSADEIYNLLANGGLKIYTTMNKEWQENTQKILNDDKSIDKTKVSDYLFPRNNDLTPLQEDLQASAVVMDYRTGEVKVIIGGRGEQGPRTYNRAASNNFLRAPGSTIKPLTVYGPAIDTKKLTAGTIIEDSPLDEETRKKYNVADTKKGGKILQYPRNAPDKYAGYLNLRYGLKESKNTVAMKVVDQVGLSTAAEYGRKFGLKINTVDEHSLASLALGQLTVSGGTSGANPLMLATAYGSFGNNGVMTSPLVYTKVVDSNGEIILEPERSTQKVLSPEASYIMYDLLKEPVTNPGIGTGTRAMLDGMDTRGKTGTSADRKDLWFTGFTPYYSCSVWVGNDDYSVIKYKSGNYFGSNSVAGIWNKIMQPIHEGLENKAAVEMPNKIKKEKISKDSGTLPTDLTEKDPRKNRIYEELFIDGTVPTEKDDVHVLLKVVTIDGKDYLPNNYTNETELIEKVYITRESLPFTGPDRKSYTLLDQKYVAPTEKAPIDDELKKLLELFGADPEDDSNSETPDDIDTPNE
ncbi:transglycosylase domain-containing protein [Oceanirhabdus sp. W0125-5]|uniref:transglycosylase domain-containing protein n=1 Tax=Oceanirhabdus sp. W0125-5 TaxID=2999116 RepID=UPI0022F2C8D3|nr:transglycosylase domain-containing protein [Oceanirhabdus sp. W0125-5]WBW99469.1 transglycosylase domain-containing protein [Oceanirhabdus sp. W0125-5]